MFFVVRCRKPTGCPGSPSNSPRHFRCWLSLAVCTRPCTNRGSTDSKCTRLREISQPPAPSTCRLRMRHFIRQADRLTAIRQHQEQRTQRIPSTSQQNPAGGVSLRRTAKCRHQRTQYQAQIQSHHLMVICSFDCLRRDESPSLVSLLSLRPPVKNAIAAPVVILDCWLPTESWPHVQLSEKLFLEIPSICRYEAKRSESGFNKKAAMT